MGLIQVRKDSHMVSWGGKRHGAGRPRSGFVRATIAETGRSRTSIYRDLRRASRLTPEAMAFAISRKKLVTGKALEIAGEFETAGEQIAALQLAVEMRKARRRPSLIETIQHLRTLEAEARRQPSTI
jgi:uncharacterized protein (UPF0371 family)